MYKQMFHQSIKLFRSYLKLEPSKVIFNASLKRTMFTNKEENHIVWIDMEMTGLEIEKCHILEISCAITNANLNIITSPMNVVINKPNSVLCNMNDWCKEHHTKSKLIEEVLNSNISLKEAEKMILKYLENHVPKHKCPLGGNSVYMDRLFLIKYMPLVHDYLNYRNIDVSTIKELARRWNPQVYNNASPKSRIHRALPDIIESIKELDYYRNYIFLQKES